MILKRLALVGVLVSAGFALFSDHLNTLKNSTVKCTLQSGTVAKLAENNLNEAVHVCSRRFGPLKPEEERTVSGLPGEKFDWKITGRGVLPIPISRPLF
jgi:hypothetical protein